MSLVIDDRAFLAALPAAFAELEVLANEENKTLAGRIRDVAKQHAPVAAGQVPAGETPGELRDSLKVTEGVEGAHPFVEVGTSVPYADYIEFGTSKMSARPFMRPAIAQET